MGRPERDCVGNVAADTNAGGAAAARAVPPDKVEFREHQIKVLGLAQRTLALTDLAAVKANHGQVGDSGPRVRRRWGDARRGARAAALRAASASIVQATNAARRPGGQVPDLLHNLERDRVVPRCTMRWCADMGLRFDFGKEGGYMEDTFTGEQIPLHRRDNLYVVNAWVRSDPSPGMPPNSSPPFVGPVQRLMKLPELNL